MKNKTSSDSNKANNLIKQIEQIAKKAKKSKMKIDPGTPEYESSKILADFLGCEPMQAILFTVIFQLSFDEECVSIYTIAKHLNCNTLRILEYRNDIEKLRSLKLVTIQTRPNRFAQTNFQELYISARVTEAITTMNKELLHEPDKLELIPLLERIYDLMDERSEGLLNYTEMADEIKILLKSNGDNKFIKRLSKFDLTEREMQLFLFVCRETIKGDNTTDLNQACNKIWSETADRFEMKRRLVKNQSNLIKHDLMQLQDGVFRGDREIFLTEKALDIFLEDDIDIIQNNENKVKGIISCESINKSNLFFNARENKQIEELVTLLKITNFKKIQSRLKKQGMPTGITLLFHGSPGTGKTASTYQIARNTGRDIMMVDISDTKSMWFGESEKRIKAVFSDYNKAIKYSKVVPILVFNEADAVFSKRKDVSDSAVGQTENAIQNIILQEMEDFKGILIATTNLTHNFDKAFERRFLYKIEFSKPDITTRTNIWMDKIPGLTSSQAGILASRFEITGGSIDNVARKVLMTDILKGKKFDIQSLINYCEQETLVNENRRKIGF
jgi:hypothetical protein